MKIRELSREEIKQIWRIDRSEIIKNIYYFENDTLVLKPEYYDIPGWVPGEREQYHRLLTHCFERGGWFRGIFDEDERKILGVVILDNEFIGKNNDTLQLKFLHVSKACRKSGYGKQLFDLACAAAKKKGTRKLYISATPSENTINFYLKQGCSVTKEPDPQLFELEPEDIHLECSL